ncbi:Acyl-CoA reductase [Propionibacterium cyclohexanicum]|uniref:Acyl-CoA reductase n=1 Tax=Propionibacterium cyclohexanicum TaxID=64702 RepID=A0A1H9SHE2_9ACTN|nr:aldehyde dehydrogenase family protein [Propionibacterium cyclohexanicum]SER84382.1 Acyl-CoA reductase [Propionibacterium cyclohexanicum]
MSVPTFTEHDATIPEEGVLTVVDPRDGSVVDTVAVDTPETANEAIRRAWRAQPGWARTAAADRSSRLTEAAGLLEARAAQLAEINTRETGRPTGEAIDGIRAGVATLRSTAVLGTMHGGTRLAGQAYCSDYSRREPRGVAVALTPWNDPVAVACELAAAALVTGNCLILKPSEHCPRLGREFGRILTECLPEGVVQTLTGGPALGAALVSHPLVGVVAHIGSSSTGRKIQRLTADSGVHLVLENGGNDPLVVDAGVDPQWAAAQIALGAFANSGQVCTSVERVYVHESVAGPVVDALVHQAEQINESGELGPLVDGALRERVHAQVDAAARAGARILVGGEIGQGPGFHYPATVITDCRPDMELTREETFGPIAPIQVVGSFEEGLALASQDRYGLAATVLTPDLAHAQRAVEELCVGTVKINEVFGGAPGGSATPRGASGNGCGYGPGLLDEMTVVKVVHIAPARIPGVAAPGGVGDEG